MRTFLIALLIGACGILKPPYQPFGCNGDWVCICDSNQDCDWVLICKE